MNVKKLGSPSNPLPPPHPLLSYYNGSLEKRGPSLVLSTSCSAHFKPLQAPTVHHLPLCCSAQIGPRLLKFSTCSLGSLRLVQPGVWVWVGVGCHISLKGRAANACIACSDPPQPLCLPGSFKALHSDPPSLRAGAEEEPRRRARRPIVLLHKAARGDGRLLEKQSHPGGAIIFPPAISPVCG